MKTKLNDIKVEVEAMDLEINKILTDINVKDVKIKSLERKNLSTKW